MELKEPVIVSAVRTPIGSINGCFSSLTAHELGSCVIKEALDRCSVNPNDVSEVILGQVLSGGQGQNPARQAAFGASIPHTSTAMGINMVCGSGLKSVALGAQSIKCGDSNIVVAGGQESMTRSVHSVFMRSGCKFGHTELSDTMIKDGLTDAFNNYHMGITAENVAKKFDINRNAQDEFSAESQRKTSVALEQGFFEQEICPISISGGRNKPPISINKDEYPRPETNVETLSKLKPAFIRDGTGTVTAGNASGLNDGAAVVVLMDRSEAIKRGIPIMARIVAHATAGVEPEIMGIGPIPAIRKVLDKCGWEINDVDLFELNEAFASQSLAIIKELEIDASKVNVNGGSIALGHPIGASGCRILVTLIHAMRRLNKKKGLAALCIGGGMGIAMCIETV